MEPQPSPRCSQGQRAGGHRGHAVLQNSIGLAPHHQLHSHLFLLGFGGLDQLFLKLLHRVNSELRAGQGELTAATFRPIQPQMPFHK